MIITQKTFTEEALKFIEPGKAYDRAFIAKDVADSIADQLYEELGRTKSMTMIDVNHLKSAFYTAAISLIDWTRCNRKVNPQEYADTYWRTWTRKETLNDNV